MSNVTQLRPRVEEWKTAPDWARWSTVDSDGTVTVWQDKPSLASRQWVPDNLHSYFAIVGINPPMRPYWESSLTRIHSPKVPTHASFADGKAREQLRNVLFIGSALFAILVWWAML